MVVGLCVLLEDLDLVFLSTLVAMAGDWFLVLALDFGLLVVAMVFGWLI